MNGKNPQILTIKVNSRIVGVHASSPCPANDRVCLARGATYEHPVFGTSQGRSHSSIKVIFRDYPELSVPCFYLSLFRLFTMPCKQISSRESDRITQVFVVVARNFSRRELSEECSQFKRSMGNFILLDGERNPVRGPPALCVVRREPFAQSTWTREQIND